MISTSRARLASCSMVSRPVPGVWVSSISSDKAVFVPSAPAGMRQPMSEQQAILEELRAIRATQQAMLHILYSLGGYGVLTAEKNPIPWVSPELLQPSVSEALSAHLAAEAFLGASSEALPGHSAAECLASLDTACINRELALDAVLAATTATATCSPRASKQFPPSCDLHEPSTRGEKQPEQAQSGQI